jgi:ribose transport system permease protein
MKEQHLDSPLVATPTTQPRLTRSLRRGWAVLLARQEFTVFLLLLTMGFALSMGTDTFFTATNLLNVAIYVSWFAIAAFGVGVAIIVGGVDLSVGSVMALAGLVCALALQNGADVIPAVLSGALVGVLVGVVNGTLVGYYRLPPFIVTLGTMGLARGITLGLTAGAPVRDLPSDFRWLGQGELLIGSLPLPLPVLLALGLALCVSLILQRTVLGHYIYTVARDERALLFTGVPTERVKLLAYTLSSLLAALGGMVMTAKLGVAAPMAALGYELDIIAAAVIGGVSLFGGEGSVIGIVLGTVLMQIARNGLVLLGLPTFWQWLTIGAVILMVILFEYWRRRREI